MRGSATTLWGESEPNAEYAIFACSLDLLDQDLTIRNLVPPIFQACKREQSWKIRHHPRCITVSRALINIPDQLQKRTDLLLLNTYNRLIGDRDGRRIHPSLPSHLFPQKK